MDEAKVVEVTRMDGKVVVTFSDGKIAILDDATIRPFAVDPSTLDPSPLEDWD
jgi:hypothetical protein